MALTLVSVTYVYNLETVIRKYWILNISHLHFTTFLLVVPFTSAFFTYSEKQFNTGSVLRVEVRGLPASGICHSTLSVVCSGHSKQP